VESENTNGVLRFGVFEVNLRAGEVRRQGVKVKLQDQPFHVLAMLLERPGELVTREELRDRIWPAGIYVDYEKSVSKAINKIREALGDSSENPRFIETLPRRGYRFLGPVEGGQPAKPITPPLLRSPEASKPVESSWSRRHLSWVVMATLALAITVGTSIWIWGKRPLREPGPSALIAAPLTTYPGRQSFPSFSPDGNQIAFAWTEAEQHNANIYVKLIGTENLLRLTNDPANDYAPAWSPDGRHLAFLRDLRPGRAAVLIVPSLGGTPERKLIEIASIWDVKVGYGEPGLSWSPDGKWLAIKDRQEGEAQDSVYLVSVETGERRRLTHPTPVSGDGSPAFSPDGKHLAFSRTFTFGVSEVYVLDLSNGPTARGVPKQISFRKQRTVGLAWTRNGREIIFASGSGDSEEGATLWRVSVSGSGAPRLLALAGEHGSWPAISFQGDRLAFSRHYAQDQNVWRLPISGSSGETGKAVRLIASTRNDYGPQYSPDGKRIVFISQRTGRDEVWVCNDDGSGVVQLTSLGAAITGGPRWSPDGARIVFDSNAVGIFHLYVVDSSGGQPKRLTDTTADDALASWSRDGRSIYFTSNRTKSWEIWKIPADGGTATQVTRNGGSVAFESVDGNSLYYTKRPEENKLWRMPVRGGEETEVLEDIVGSSYSVLENGIYFIRTAGAGGSPELQFLDFATRKIQRISPLHHLSKRSGLSVSPDGQYAIYTQEDQLPGSDLMLVENFR
jgi:Tol biopolymer transport system component/DNA-binding winged helix-turn-helix (wHTH) protein